MLTHDETNKQFIWESDGGDQSVVLYRTLPDGLLVLWHSEVPRHLRGKGIGQQLVEATFAWIRDHQLKARATCSYIRTQAYRNPEWKGIIE